jgi:tetratricopeptide (TPR) repeat protein
MDWAMIQNNLGNAYGAMGERGDTDALDKAVTAYKAALTIRTQEAAPMGWAMTQNNLGTAYMAMGERGDTDVLDKAVTAYKAALSIRTQDAAPLQWANSNIIRSIMKTCTCPR